MVQRSHSEWSKLVDEFDLSKLTQDEFCADNGINPNSFRQILWRIRKLRKQQKLRSQELQQQQRKEEQQQQRKEEQQQQQEPKPSVGPVARTNVVRPGVQVSIQVGMTRVDFYHPPHPDYLISILTQLSKSGPQAAR